MTKYSEAIDDIFTRCKFAWETSCADILSYSAELRYQGVEADQFPDTTAVWGRASIRTVSQTRANVGQLNDSGAARYRTRGLVMIECFGSKLASGSFDSIRSLASSLRMFFLEYSSPNRVIMRNPKIDEFYYMDLQWYRIQMICEFEFDEIL
jgi:hypothetical protein